MKGQLINHKMRKSVAEDLAEPKLEGESSRSHSETPVEIKTQQAKGEIK